MSIKCPNCGKTFRENNAAFQHIKAKHGGKGIAPFRPQNQPGYEPSFAERAIEAEIDHAMGVENPDYDWLVEPTR
jgi:hypothetical protein